jgi:RNA polymerase sigma factor (sigma-70 family)
MKAQLLVEKRSASEPETSSDGDLIRACRAGDEKAWQQLLDKYERLVYSIPLNHGLRREEAADIAQITFTALIQSLESLRDDSNLGGWLAVVARRHTWRVLQRHRREVADELDPETIGALIPDPANDLQRWEMTEWISSGLALIGDRCRDLLVALYFEPGEPSYAEVARRLGLAAGSIGAIRGRCLQRLHEILTRQD